MKRLLLILLAVVVLIPVAALVAAHWFLSEDSLRTRIEAAVQRATGRELVIRGPIHLTWSLAPTIQADDVGFANPPGFSRKLMAHVDRIELSVALLPLLSHHVSVDSLVLAAPDILLERGPNGQPNWVFAPPPAAAAPAAAPPSGGQRFDLQLGNVELRDAKLAWRGPETVAVAVPHLAYDPRSGRVAGELELRGTVLKLSGTAGPGQAAAWPLDLHLDGGGLRLTVSGTAGAAGVALEAADLSALSTLAGRSLPPIQNVRLAATLASSGLRDFQLSTGGGRFGALTLQQATATAATLAGPLDAHAQLSVASLSIAATIHADSLAQLFGGQEPVSLTQAFGAKPPLAFRLATDDAVLDGKGTLSAAGIGTLALTGRVGNFAALGTLAQVALPRLNNLKIDTVATFSPESLALNGLKLTSTQADLEGNLFLGRFPRPTLRGALNSTRLDLDGLAPLPVAAPSSVPPAPLPGPPPASASVGPLIPDTPIPFATLRAADANLQLQVGALTWHRARYDHVALHLLLQDGKLRLDPASIGLGNDTLAAQVSADAGAQSVAAKIDAPGLPATATLALFGIPASGNGTIDAHIDLKGQGATWRALAAGLQGQVGVALVNGEIDNAWLVDELEGALREAHLPIPTGGSSTVRCAAIRADVDAGKATLRALTLDTSKLALDGTGEVNLANETLDLHVRPVVRLGAALSVPIQISGPLRKPKVGLDKGALAPGRVGIVIGGRPPTDSCTTSLALARDGQAGPAPTAPDPAANKPPKPADLLRSLLR